MSNIFHDSNKLVSEIMNNQVPKGSIVHLQWPSGAQESVRFHGMNHDHGKMIGCNMNWDNGATEWYDLNHAFIEKVVYPKMNDERWKS